MSELTPQQVLGFKNLREPFEPHQISKLPKPLLKRDEMDKIPKSKCKICGGYHANDKIVHLDYVGHAALTDRLLDVDPEWNWEPLSFDANGLPMLDTTGGMWIKLTVCGVTRLGYGDADGKTGGNAVKERIGDALRNAAMRFGCALDLWHKGDLHKAGDPNEWTEDEKQEARDSCYALADQLGDLGLSGEEQGKMIAQPLSGIGDSSVGFQRWHSRFLTYSDRAIAKTKEAVSAKPQDQTQEPQ